VPEDQLAVNSSAGSTTRPRDGLTHYDRRADLSPLAYRHSVVVGLIHLFWLNPPDSPRRSIMGDPPVARVTGRARRGLVGNCMTPDCPDRVRTGHPGGTRRGLYAGV
jgi:hypothetical protein